MRKSNVNLKANKLSNLVQSVFIISQTEKITLDLTNIKISYM